MKSTNTRTVVNLLTGDQYVYVCQNSKDALIATYRQSIKKDFNTWDYHNKEHEELIIYGQHTMAIGDLCVIRDDIQTPEKESA